MKTKLWIVLALAMVTVFTMGAAAPVSQAPAGTQTALVGYIAGNGKVATPTASVTKQNGNKNLLTVTVTERYTSIDREVVSTEQFSIDNNAAGTYKVGNYNVYVDTKGNTQIRDCYIVSSDPTSLSTFTRLDESGLYYMEYLEDYKFDDFLQVGAANDEELAAYLQDVLLDGLPVEITPPAYGCSVFSGELEDSGDRILARNFDNSDAPFMIVETNPENGFKSISTVNLSFIGYTKAGLLEYENETEDFLLPTLVAPYVPLDGVNEKGLAIGVLQLNYLGARQADATKIDLPTTTMIRLILDQAETVDDALDLMRQYNMRDSLSMLKTLDVDFPSFHYQISDKSGRSVVVEYVNNVMKVIEQKEGENYHFVTNFFLSPEAESLPGIGSTVKPSYASTCWRYNGMKAVLEANGGIFADEMAAMDLLNAVKQSSTLWSVVYNLEKLTVTFVPMRQYDKPAYLFAV